MVKQTREWYAKAEAVIMAVLQQQRPILLKAFGNVAHTLKDDKSVVTELDKKLEQELRAALIKFDDSIPIVGEEFGGDISAETFWLIDPIDGTESFIRGLPLPRNMVALVVDNEPVFALVYKFVTDELYIAIKDQGTTRNGQAVHVSQRPLDRVWPELGGDFKNPEVIKKFMELNLRVQGFAQLRDFPAVAKGAVDGLIIFHSHGGIWDIVPRALLIKEAGGRISNVGSSGYNIREMSLIATNPVIFEAVTEIMNS
ncbi:MAG: inositol monophosphatase, monophosphatase [Candidatus Saccharibacteria bacterium]|nr:inositol monophosphatase, monophosphatase [Candidatus Saccharibacteria bacterium]